MRESRSLPSLRESSEANASELSFFCLRELGGGGLVAIYSIGAIETIDAIESIEPIGGIRGYSGYRSDRTSSD